MDLTKIGTQVKEHIRNGILALIPEDEWDKLIKQEVETFFTDVPRNEYGHNTRWEPSSFKKIVQVELEKELRTRITAYFARPEWELRWNWDVKGVQSFDVIGQSLRDFVNEMAPVLSRAFFADMLSRFIQSAR